jgi:hypothetical protein
MNPYIFVRDSLQEHGGPVFQRCAVSAVLTLMADTYPGDLDASDRPFDYVLRHVMARFGERHPIADALLRLRSETIL